MAHIVRWALIAYLAITFAPALAAMLLFTAPLLAVSALLELSRNRRYRFAFPVSPLRRISVER